MTETLPPNDGAPDREPLLRRLSVWGIWLLVVNGTIGAGIFGLPARAAELTGVYSPLIFLLCGVLLVPVVLAFAEVSSFFRGTGGPILYARTAFGPLAGFETGWAFYVARLSASAANVSLLVATLGYFWEGAAHGAVRVVLLFAICGALTWVNFVGAKHAMRSIGVLTVLKFVPLLLLVAIGAWHFDTSAYTETTGAAPGFGDVGSASLLLVYAYVGWESALVPAGEARDPARDMPRALLWGLAGIVALYVAVQAVAVSTLPDLAASERPLVDVADTLLGPVGALILTAGVVVSVGGNVASAMFSTPRITYAMARERLLPQWFGAVHATHRTPSASVLLYGAIVFVLASIGSFAWLAEVSVLTRILIYGIGIASLGPLRKRFADAPGRLRLAGGRFVPVLGLAVCLALLSQVGLHTVVVTAGFLAVGSLLYALARWQASRPK